MNINLTAFRVYRHDGTFYTTSMAEGVTLERARKYFMGTTQYAAGDHEEKHPLTVVAVDVLEYTALVRTADLGEHGTTWIDTVAAPSIALAIAMAEGKAALEWECEREAVKCIGIFAGPITPLFWEDVEA